jgi:large subunit ribosomal protein L9
VEVILLEKIRNLGALGDKVRVKPGFARNYLIPQGKAAYANEKNLAKFEQRRAELEKLATEKMQQASAMQQKLNALQTITVTAKAGDEGKLFGSVTTRDIADALAKAGVTVEKRQVRLPEGGLRLVGEFEIIIDLEGDLTSTVKLVITPEA